MKSKLHPFEFVGAYKLYEEERFLLADEMGMFKTAQAIFANSKFRQKNKKIRTLIVTPTSVREHWARELQKWAYPKGTINIVYSKNLQEKLADSKNTDWTVISYPIMSKLNENLLNSLQNIGFHHVILDEVHNAKNPDALRTRAIKKLANNADYLSLLSGTPIPNTMSDLYILMSLLDPEKYPFELDGVEESLLSARQSFIQLYIDRPQAVKELLHKKMLRRTINNYLPNQIPELITHRVEIPLSGLHLETYQSIVEKEMNVGKKIMDLEKASLDPLLVNNLLKNKINEKNISLKYQFLDDVVEREMSKPNGKVLIFSNLKEGIIDPLIEYYKRFGAIKITGDIETEYGTREKLRQKFQHDSRTRILIATTTMHEGVDLTAATVVFNLTIPWTPAEYYQRFKRSQRPGEIKKDKVEVYMPFTTIPGPQDSLEKAALEMLDTKEKIVSYLLRGMQVSMEELKSFDERKRVPTIVHAITSPNKAIFKYYLRWRGIGSQSALRRIKGSPELSKYIAELYPSFNMARNAADIYIPIIKKLEKKSNLETKVDIGCGPGMLSHFLNESSIGIDISQDMLNIGRELNPKNTFIQGDMSNLPLQYGIADFTLCSLAYQMTEPRKERAKSLQEMSRILRKNGHAIIILPGNYMNTRNINKFERVANSYGFVIKNHERKVGPSQLDFYVLQKIHDTRDVIYRLKWNGD